MLRVIGNVIWLLIAGWELAVGWLIGGILLCLTIVGIPFGVQAFKISAYVLWPFGRTVVRDPRAGAGSAVGNVLWILLAGWWLALLTVVVGLLLFVSIIGIPLGIACFKMLPMVFRPFGRTIVPSDSPSAIAGHAYAT